MVSKLINDNLRPLLEAQNLLDLDSLFNLANAETVKALLAVRQTFKIQAADGTVLYIKRYTNPAADRFWDLLGARRFPSPASREYTVLLRLAELEIPAPQPAACLEEISGRRVRRAALVTLSLPPAVNLETLARGNTLNPRRRAALARNLGQLTRTMHEGGVNHRDFYFVHLLVDSDDRIHVTDLNRADIRQRVGRRWRVKDLGALLQSAPPEVTLSEKVRFARAYLASPLRQHRRLLADVQAKADTMKARTRKRVAQGRPNYHVAD